PGHLGDVNQTFDARLKLYERSVVRHRSDLALHALPLWEALRHRLPGVGKKLLEAQAYALAILVELQDLDLNVLADAEHLAGVLQASPTHVRDVQEAVNA